MKVVVNDKAKSKVRQVLPSDLSLSERANRLNVFGLSGRDAVRLERMRQKGVTGPRLAAARIDLSLQRGNIVVLTEVNRILNASVEALWLENLGISKARRSDRVVQSLQGIPSRAKKTIITRRDDRVCHYCLPLEGAQARIGTQFRTRYGLFHIPPFHPRCRCYMIVSV
jgi:hypothetical protein